MQDIMISDFTACKTISGQEVAQSPGWKLTDYRHESGKGVMLIAAGHEAGEDLIFYPAATGWHRIYVGIYNHDFRVSVVKLKLSDDAVFRKVMVGAHAREAPGFIEEGFWKCADMTDRQFIIQKAGSQRGNIAYIRLAPMSEQEIEQLKRSRLEARKYKLGAVFDVGDLALFESAPYTKEMVQSALEPFVHSDFQVICWGTTNSTDTYMYHTRMGEVFGQGITDFYGEGIKKTADFMQASLDGGWDPFAEAVAFCHKHGMEIYADYRIEHTYDINAYNGNFTGKFQREHQHCRMTERDGSKSPLLSLAYEEVRDFKVSVLLEMASYGVDGIYIDFGRASPVVSYDPPIVEGFRAKYGKDPLELDSCDKEWISYRAEFVTAFIRQLREQLRNLERKTGRTIKLATQVEYGYWHTADPHCNLIDKNLVLGYDLEVWAKEGLVDIIAPAENSRMYAMYNLDLYKHMVQGTACELWPVIGQFDNSMFPLDYDWEAYYMTSSEEPRKQLRMLNAERLERNAADCYGQGADGLFVWEAGDIPCYLHRWNRMKDFGHREDIVERWGNAAARFDQAPNISVRQLTLAESGV